MEIESRTSRSVTLPPNPGVSMSVTRRPSRSNGVAEVVLVQALRPFPTGRVDPLTQLMNYEEVDQDFHKKKRLY